MLPFPSWALAADLLALYDIPYEWNPAQRRILIGSTDIAPTYRDDGVQASIGHPQFEMGLQGGNAPVILRGILRDDRAWCRVLEFAQEFGITAFFEPFALGDRLNQEASGALGRIHQRAEITEITGDQHISLAGMGCPIDRPVFLRQPGRTKHIAVVTHQAEAINTGQKTIHTVGKFPGQVSPGFLLGIGTGGQLNQAGLSQRDQESSFSIRIVSRCEQHIGIKKQALRPSCSRLRMVLRALTESRSARSHSSI
ncbi:hypothetical protein [Cyanobium sp. ULC082]